MVTKKKTATKKKATKKIVEKKKPTRIIKNDGTHSTGPKKRENGK